MEWRYISDKIHDTLQYFDEGEANKFAEEQNFQGINMNSILALDNIFNVQDYYNNMTKIPCFNYF